MEDNKKGTQPMVTPEILNGVGKKMRSAFLAGKLSEKEVITCYTRNKRDADAFDPMGWSIHELIAEEKNTHNPIKRAKLQILIQEHKEKSRASNDQNRLSMLKLEFYRDKALSIGLRGVLRELHKISGSNTEAEIILTLLEAEFANLTAKRKNSKKEVIYERKDLLLMRVSDLLYEAGWKCGLSYETGKNALCIIYVYLPNGTQVSFHCTNYLIMDYYDEIECMWDGQPCSTLEKLLDYAHHKFGIGNEAVMYEIAA